MTRPTRTRADVEAALQRARTNLNALGRSNPKAIAQARAMVAAFEAELREMPA